MKFFLFGLALLIAGASAFPEAAELDGRQSEGEQFAANLRRILGSIQRYLINNNLDPYIVQRRDRTYVRFPLINIKSFVENLNYNGLSNMKINELEYSNIFSRLRFDFEFPQLEFNVGSAGVDGTVFSRNISSSLSGKLTISNIRLAGDAFIQADIITGRAKITQLDARFSIGSIECNVNVRTSLVDYTEAANNFMNVRLPAYLKSNESTINRILGRFIRFVAQFYLDHRVRP